MKSAEIHVGYFKQGDDLQGCLSNCDNHPIKSLSSYARMLKDCSVHIDRIVHIIATNYEDEIKEIEITADCHFIEISGPDNLIDELVEQGLAVHIEEEEEEEEEPEESA
mgnify:CR=1 FL=1